MLTYHILHYTDLSTDQLYQLMRLRQEVFVVEQDCPYLDADNRDQRAYHIFGIDNEETLHSCARLLPSGISYPGYASIGRVVTSTAYRGKGEGFHLMKKCIEKAAELSWLPLKLSAQVYAIAFYKKLGFHPIGEEYLEDNIPHIAMVMTRENLEL